MFNLTLEGTCSSNQTAVESLTGNAPNFNVANWQSSEVLVDPFSTCGIYSILGGISIGIANSFFSYTINNLPVHSILHVSFNLLLIDQTPQDNYQYQISVDNVLRSISFIIPTSLTNECGSSQPELLRS